MPTVAVRYFTLIRFLEVCGGSGHPLLTRAAILRVFSVARQLTIDEGERERERSPPELLVRGIYFVELLKFLSVQHDERQYCYRHNTALAQGCKVRCSPIGACRFHHPIFSNCGYVTGHSGYMGTPSATSPVPGLLMPTPCSLAAWRIAPVPAPAPLSTILAVPVSVPVCSTSLSNKAHQPRPHASLIFPNPFLPRGSPP